MDKPAPCDIVQHADQTVCYSCGLKWDTNDPAPPPCVPYHGRRVEDLQPEPPPLFYLALVSLVGTLALIHFILSGAGS